MSDSYNVHVKCLDPSYCIKQTNELGLQDLVSLSKNLECETYIHVHVTATKSFFCKTYSF